MFELPSGETIGGEQRDSARGLRRRFAQRKPRKAAGGTTPMNVVAEPIGPSTAVSDEDFTRLIDILRGMGLTRRCRGSGTVRGSSLPSFPPPAPLERS